MAYLGNGPGVASQRVTDTFSVSTTTTTFTPSAGYTVGYLDVFHNGVKLVNGDDYTASNGTTFVLATAANNGDTVECVAYIPRGLSDGYTKAEADAKYPTKANNLSDLTSASTARTNLGLGSLATVSPTGTPNGSKFLRDDNTWQTVSVTPTAVSDQANTSTGYFDLPHGTTAQRPSSPSVGYTRYNTDLSVVESYHGSANGWVALSNTFSATGGAESTFQSGGTTYKTHTFTQSGYFTVSSGAKVIDVFLVAGGGGGGNGNPVADGNGGGGAGGVLWQSANYTATSASYQIVIGAGGAGGAAVAGGIGTNGQNTTGFGFTAIGGGGGGTDTPAVGSGGSGGGASCSGTYSGVRAGGSGTSGQGSAGGGAYNGAGPGGGGGGGGGAGAVGATGQGSGTAGGAGGAGVSYSVDNVTYYYGGGGGGSTWYSPGGVGGIGGGGGGGGRNGSTAAGGGSARNSGGNASGASGGSGGANTGGGGGSGTSGGSAGQGGSGIVIIRYAI